MKDCVVYTAIFGNKDKLYEPFYDERCDYVCYTDNPNLSSKIWKINLVKKNQFSLPILNAKWYKLFPNKVLSDYKFSIWVDGNVEIVGPVYELVSLCGNNAIAAYSAKYRKHDLNFNCIYDLAKETLSLVDSGRFPNLNKEKINILVRKMHSEGFPADYGLIAGMVIIREHGSVVVDKLMNEWWQYILEYCTRDELSFDYLCWKHNVKYSILPGDCCCNEYFINHKHFNESLVVGA